MNIRAARLDKGLTTRAAALKIGVNRQTLLDAEKGRRPTPEIAKRIADFYETTVTTIWPLDEEPTDPPTKAAA